MYMLKEFDIELYEAIEKEKNRQVTHLELIASENYVSDHVLTVTGSILTNKYAEGYPGRRYYGGCENVDEIEDLARARLKKLYGASYVNVQPHSGSQANMAAYRALLKNGDKVMGLALDHGGHLTHGHSLSFSGIDYDFHSYYVDKETEMINYDELEELAKKIKPKLIVTGASAYPRSIDFKRFNQIARSVGAYLMVDMAHIAGVVAAGLHQNPIPYADIVTSTTHKTLRGPRGGIILTNNEDIAKTIDRVVFPGIQGGPLMHIIAGKAVAFKEALEEDFITYQKQVVTNAKLLADELQKRGFYVVTGGTDTHMVLLNVKKTHGFTGKVAEVVLGEANITCNKNTVPYDTEKPLLASGIRLGTPAITTRGFKEKEIIEVAELIARVLNNINNKEVILEVKERVEALTKPFPLFQLQKD
ncbi:MAG TPA: serine hydroxymethyltransferase [Acholeplasmataceae bacterium]|nr:serine hydroxymethyltransferase [Acholeplasmataceae bacterium]